MVMHIDILLFDGFDELDAIAPYEYLRRANEFGAEFAVRLVTCEKHVLAVTAFYGLRITPDGVLNLEHPAQVIIVPGGGWNHHGDRGARVEAERGRIPNALVIAQRNGAILAGVCTGAMLIASAGLLRNRPATTHHLAREELRALGAEVITARVVDDGDIITAGGVTSGVDLASWITERFAGPAIAVAVEDRLEYERRGTVWRRGEVHSA
jgi:transcriptional regulator GlxA family with amidase domain